MNYFYFEMKMDYKMDYKWIMNDNLAYEHGHAIEMEFE